MNSTRLWTIGPKSPFQWLLFCLLALALTQLLRPNFHETRVILGTVLFLAAATLLLFLPSRPVAIWINLPPLLRSILAGILGYVVIGSLGLLPEATTLRGWRELLFHRGAAPLTIGNGLGLVGAWFFALSQSYSGPQKSTPEKYPTRGPKLISHEEAKAIAKSRTLAEEETFFWGALSLPIRCTPEHFLVVGESGSGKTRTIHLLLNDAIKRITPGSNRRMLLYDAKRDFYSVVSAMDAKVPIQTLNPFDKRSVAWHIAKDVDDGPSAVEIATILVPDQMGESFFPNAARILLSGVMESFIRSASKEWTLRDLVLTLRYPLRTKILLKNTEHTRYLINKYANEARSHQDVASTLENFLRRLSFIAAAWEHAEKISLEDWHKGEKILLLGNHPTLGSTLAQLNCAIVHRVSQLVRTGEEANRVKGRPRPLTWIILDELRTAGKFGGLNDLLLEGRSKGAAIVLGFQDLSGLKAVYGEANALEIIGSCGNKAVLRTGDPDTQDYASRIFGSQEIDLPNLGTSAGTSQTSGRDSSSQTTSSGSSLNYSRMTRPVVLGSEFLSSLPRPTEKTGFWGFYSTAIVGHPYPAGISQQEANQRLNGAEKGKPDVKDLDPRDKTDLDLKEWVEADLRRLNLTEFTKELLDPEGEKGGGTSWLDVVS